MDLKNLTNTQDEEEEYFVFAVPGENEEDDENTELVFSILPLEVGRARFAALEEDEEE